ncbi:unnamed protein product [Gemmata massiliana]|uniref:Uncharacterized protein n=1 Tax=Gemmata massiliana TaxID=1210884 RepID=A0A6P2DCF7_9BACT|nr:hypothetical protein [Gemmata massiliana]VTR98383.1 unnamed protein product [Gemmata massiliana]
MKTRYLIAVCAVPFVVCGVILAQQPAALPPGATPNLPTTGGRPEASPPAGGLNYEYKYDKKATFPVPTVAHTEANLDGMAIEQLIEAMEKTRAEIVEREKLNQMRLKVLQEKVGKVKVRMDSFSGQSQPPVKIPPGHESLNSPFEQKP